MPQTDIEVTVDGHTVLVPISYDIEKGDDGDDVQRMPYTRAVNVRLDFPTIPGYAGNQFEILGGAVWQAISEEVQKNTSYLDEE